jgi:hypothetical protein
LFVLASLELSMCIKVCQPRWCPPTRWSVSLTCRHLSQRVVAPPLLGCSRAWAAALSTATSAWATTTTCRVRVCP